MIQHIDDTYFFINNNNKMYFEELPHKERELLMSKMDTGHLKDLCHHLAKRISALKYDLAQFYDDESR